MLTTNILDSFEPFNDIWYINCSYHSFFPIVMHFNKDIRAFMCNNVFAYAYSPEKNIVNPELKSVSDIMDRDIFDDLEIGLTERAQSDNIIYDLFMAIDANNPVIIPIDLYYQPVRVDTFNKHHWPHSLLIYGYDKSQNKFHIIEQKNGESILYEKSTINFEDLANCYNGFLHNIRNDKDSATYFEYFSKNTSYKKKSSEIVSLKYQKLYVDNYKNNTKKLYEGLGQFNLFIKDAEKILLNKPTLDERSYALFYALNNIINLRTVERYTKLKLLNVDSDFVSVDEHIIGNWNFIRGIIAKYRYSGKYNLKSMEKSLDKLVDIYSLEKVSYEKLISF